MGKRYYWLKLPEGFFRQKPIKKLRKIAGGDTYTIIYLKMLLIAMKNDGKLYFEGVEDDFYEELALDLDEDSENVKVTVLFLIRQGLMELVDETEYRLTECDKMVGSESASAERVRKHREQKALQCNSNVTGVKRIGNVEKEIEKEIEKDTICPEVITSRPEVFISLPLVTGSGSFDVTLDYLNSLRNLYPAIDVEQEFRKMYAWLDSNPKNRKTERGIKRFITGWLGRAQDKAPIIKAGGMQDNRRMTTGQYMESTANWYGGGN
nr:MAG TPA: replisome organizer protein [Caudoviricetes sp.]